jgi:hypothetical protein
MGTNAISQLLHLGRQVIGLGDAQVNVRVCAGVLDCLRLVRAEIDADSLVSLCLAELDDHVA